MCWSTGREPMAQPPGSDTVGLAEAGQQRGPSTMMLARIVLDELVWRLGGGEPASRR